MVFGYFWDVTVLFPAKLQVFTVTKHVEETKKNRAEMADSAFRTGLKTGRSKDKMTSKLSSFLLDRFPIAYKDDDTVSKTLKLFSNKYS